MRLPAAPFLQGGAGPFIKTRGIKTRGAGEAGREAGCRSAAALWLCLAAVSCASASNLRNSGSARRAPDPAARLVRSPAAAGSAARLSQTAAQSPKRGLASPGGAISFENEEGETLNFVQQAPPLPPAAAKALWDQIRGRLNSLGRYCGGQKRPSIPKAKSLAAQIKALQNRAQSAYSRHKYSLGGAEVSIGGQTERLGKILLDISEILKLSYRPIQESGSLTAACQALKGGFIYNYYSYYNLPDETDINQRLDYWARAVFSAIKCACP